jgi:hypothetical protein
MILQTLARLSVVPDSGARRRPSLFSRLAWFAGLWLASVVALGVVAMVLRWALRA